MGVPLYLMLNKHRASATSFAPSPMSRMEKACWAGMLAGVVGFAGFVVHQVKQTDALMAEIAKPSTSLVNVSCTINKVRLPRGVKIVHRVINTYRTENGSFIVKPFSRDLERFSGPSSREADARLPFWVQTVDCPAGPMID